MLPRTGYWNVIKDGTINEILHKMLIRDSMKKHRKQRPDRYCALISESFKSAKFYFYLHLITIFSKQSHFRQNIQNPLVDYKRYRRTERYTDGIRHTPLKKSSYAFIQPYFLNSMRHSGILSLCDYDFPSVVRLPVIVDEDGL